MKNLRRASKESIVTIKSQAWREQARDERRAWVASEEIYRRIEPIWLMFR